MITLIKQLQESPFRPVAVVPGRSALSEALEDVGIEPVIVDGEIASVSRRNIAYFEFILQVLNPIAVHLNGGAVLPLQIVAHMKGVPIILHVRRRLPTPPPDEYLFADVFLVPSDETAKDLERCSVLKANIRVLPNPIAWRRKGPFHSRAGQPFRIVMASRLTPEKRQDLLLRALPNISERLGRCHVDLAGVFDPRDSPYVDSLKRISSSLGLEGVVHFLGHVDDVQNLVQTADLAVACCAREAFGRSVVEAMSVGTPSVFPSGSLPAEIEGPYPEEAVFLAGSDVGLSEAVVRVASDDGLRAQCRRVGLQIAARYRADRIVDEYLNVIKEVIDVGSSKVVPRFHPENLPTISTGLARGEGPGSRIQSVNP